MCRGSSRRHHIRRGLDRTAARVTEGPEHGPFLRNRTMLWICWFDAFSSVNRKSTSPENAMNGSARLVGPGHHPPAGRDQVLHVLLEAFDDRIAIRNELAAKSV